jgi:excisionase family DNA binding protein
MKNQVNLQSLAVLAFALLPNQSFAGYEELVARAKPAVVQIETQSEEGAGRGTGFFVSGDGFIVTNEHVIHEVRRNLDITVIGSDGTHYRVQGLAYSNEDDDIAVLKVDCLNASYLGLTPGAGLGVSASYDLERTFRLGSFLMGVGGRLLLESGFLASAFLADFFMGDNDTGESALTTLEVTRVSSLCPDVRVHSACRCFAASMMARPSSESGPENTRAFWSSLSSMGASSTSVFPSLCENRLEQTASEYVHQARPTWPQSALDLTHKLSNNNSASLTFESGRFPQSAYQRGKVREALVPKFRYKQRIIAPMRDSDSPINYTPQEPESLLTEEQLSRFLNITPRTVTDWVQTNRIRYYRLGWRSVRFRLSDVLEFIERSAVPAKDTSAPSRITVRRTKAPIKARTVQELA